MLVSELVLELMKMPQDVEVFVEDEEHHHVSLIESVGLSSREGKATVILNEC